ncbi:hypothetical protein T265_00179 [Opisthorchis viverrini]|uniref:Uncharacterized protein n=1 Tax=Opisthorchis viverrini TaxID=6198 RepID=A0A075A2N2_OPIVI|nr:hypothetical protein T265_00179 [Opisthorchis viverrini]KER33973.1 hypothetical protein T265_00179 [Opisthorchis viverrini]
MSSEDIKYDFPGLVHRSLQWGQVENSRDSSNQRGHSSLPRGITKQSRFQRRVCGIYGSKLPASTFSETKQVPKTLDEFIHNQSRGIGDVEVLRVVFRRNNSSKLDELIIPHRLHWLGHVSACQSNHFPE